MGATWQLDFRALGIISITFGVALGLASPAKYSVDERLLSGYMSHEERITEYLFNGEESRPMWA